MITFMNNLESQIRQLETRMESTRNAFMDLADEFISRIKEKIREKATPKKIEKIFDLPTPKVISEGVESGEPFPGGSPPNLPYFYEPPLEDKNSQIHRIFVGRLQVTLPNLYEAKRRSFGFKPGVKRVHLKQHSTKDPMEQIFPSPTCYDKDNDLSGIGTGPIYNHTSFRDSNETFNPGGLH